MATSDLLVLRVPRDVQEAEFPRIDEKRTGNNMN